MLAIGSFLAIKEDVNYSGDRNDASMRDKKITEGKPQEAMPVESGRKQRKKHRKPYD